MQKPLRVGILADSLKLKAWQHLTLAKILNEGFAEISVIVLNDAQASKNTGSWRYLLYRIYSRLDRTLFPAQLDPFAESEFTPGPVPVLRVRPKQTLHCDSFSEEDLEQIRNFGLDVLIRFGFRILKGEILHAAKYGVWSYHHGDTQSYRGGPPGFWEVMERSPVTGSTLQILDQNLDGGTILYESFSVTHPTSVHRNKANYYWKTALFIPRKIRELYHSGEKQFVEKTRKRNAHPVIYSKRLYSNPGNFDTMKRVIRHSIRGIGRLLSNLVFMEQWILLFRFQNEGFTSLRQFRRIVPPKDRFWADPCPVLKDGKRFIFFEEFLFAPRKGHIAVMEINPDGSHSVPVRILEKSYHLSYPFIFQHQEQHYLIPESARNKAIELYRCTEFPHRWEFVRNLLENVIARDATLLFHDNRWWLFANICEHEGVSAFDELFLFHSDDLLRGDWIPHRLNPIISDCRRARPAGKFFFKDGKLHRPSQNSSWRYGYGIKLNEVTTLTVDDYEEVPVGSIEPLWDKNIRRIHTLNFVDGLVVADAALRRPRIFS